MIIDMLALPGYAFSEELQRTEQSAIYRGIREVDGHAVVVEVLSGEHPTPDKLARLRHEYAVTKTLSTPGILSPLALEEHGYSLAIIWTDPGGWPLRRWMTDRKCSVREALVVVSSLAETLVQLHARRMIHKDLCPENIFVDTTSTKTYLHGFGIAALLAQEMQPMTSLGALEGNLAYFSPEQTGRMNRGTDRRSDLYSLGVLLYELLVGTVPFSADDPMELLQCHLVRIPTPPHELGKDIPLGVSNIVMKLLQKSAEDRYQCASGVLFDLQTALSQVDAGKSMTVFPLGQHDRSGELLLPQKLYGRDAELARLKHAWEDAKEARAELVLVRGYSGIGKSVLVHEIRKDITQARGFFAEGKFDQFNRSVPYAPLIEAFRELVRCILMEPDDRLAHYREEILLALGGAGKLFTDLIADLERIIGPQAEIPELEGKAARSRFSRLFQRLLGVFSKQEHPLVLFLDDVQWADLASLELFEYLLKSPDTKYFLLILAYRSNEVDAAHPVELMRVELEKFVSVSKIELGPLLRQDVGQFVADALYSAPESVSALVDVLFEKTEGNPFFLIQLLTALHQDGPLRYDSNAQEFVWNLEEIRAMVATDNVVAFLLDRLQRLPMATRRVLALAACIGHRFALNTLSIIGELPPLQAARDLWESLGAGLVVPLSTEYRHFSPEESGLSDVASLSYRFAHDRVQQAAYALVEQDKLALLHLRIGRLLLANMDADASDALFDVLTHMNRGRSLIENADERKLLAVMNLKAGKKAKAATAYAAAKDYLDVGISLLEPASFDTDYDLSFALHVAHAESALLAGAHDQSEKDLVAIEKRAKLPIERAEVLDLLAVLFSTQAKTAEAVRIGVEALGLLGYVVPNLEIEQKAGYDALLDEITSTLARVSIEDLANAPKMAAPQKKLAMKLLRHIALAAFGVMPALGNWLSALPVAISLREGPGDDSAPAYALLGAVLASSTTRFADAHNLVKLALATHDKGGGAHEACMLGFYFIVASHYSIHWRTLLPYLDRAYVAGLESGDMIFLSYICSHRSIARFILGDPLAEVGKETERLLTLMTENRLSAAAATQRIVKQSIACLEGKTQSAHSLQDDSFDEQAFVASMEAARMSFALYWHRTVKGLLTYLDEEPLGALGPLEQALSTAPTAFTPIASYYAALSILAIGNDLREEDKPRLTALLSRVIDKLQTWSQACKENYLPKYLLVKAEQAKQAGQVEKAADLYDQAIATAQEYEWWSDLAVANERCAKFYLEQGRTRIARAYLTDACYAYARWGAIVQVRRLAHKYPNLIPAEVRVRAYREQSTDGKAFVADEIDMLAFIRGLQALSRALVVDEVLDRLMRIVVQDVGAGRGVLLLEHDGNLRIEASSTSDPPMVQVDIGERIDNCTDLPTALVRYVSRRSESIVLDDATRENRFSADPYIVRVQPKSIACFPMVSQGRKRGVLYLENNAATAAFTSSRIELFSLLLAQASIALDNAELHARLATVTSDLEQSNATLSRANEALEAEIGQRTLALRQANESLSQELVERKLAEERQIALHEEVVRIQAERLAELSTPAIPITRDILVLPLIGSMDERRAQEVLEAALTAAHERQAKVVLLDITGLRAASGFVASILMQTAQALKLIGTEVIVTGTRPEMARALMAEGLDTSVLGTKATLESGIVGALEKAGYRWVKVKGLA